MRRHEAIALAAALAVVLAACSDSSETTPGPSGEVAGAVVPRTPEPTPPDYSPLGYDELLYALPSAISGRSLIVSPPDIIANDEELLAIDTLIKRSLVSRGLGPDVIRIVQREDDYTKRPTIAVAAIQFKGLPAEDYAYFVSSVYLLATSVTRDQHRLTGAKPVRQTEIIGGRRVQVAHWGEFDVAWYPHGDVIFIVLAENQQFLADALQALPPFDASLSGDAA